MSWKRVRPSCVIGCAEARAGRIELDQITVLGTLWVGTEGPRVCGISEWGFLLVEFTY